MIYTHCSLVKLSIHLVTSCYIFFTSYYMIYTPCYMMYTPCYIIYTPCYIMYTPCYIISTPCNMLHILLPVLLMHLTIWHKFIRQCCLHRVYQPPEWPYKMLSKLGPPNNIATPAQLNEISKTIPTQSKSWDHILWWIQNPVFLIQTWK